MSFHTKTLAAKLIFQETLWMVSIYSVWPLSLSTFFLLPGCCWFSNKAFQQQPLPHLQFSTSPKPEYILTLERRLWLSKRLGSICCKMILVIKRWEVNSPEMLNKKNTGWRLFNTDGCGPSFSPLIQVPGRRERGKGKQAKCPLPLLKELSGKPHLETCKASLPSLGVREVGQPTFLCFFS